jgi:prolyl oligopeptidase PreP (S9A serine peptidase family)
MNRPPDTGGTPRWVKVSGLVALAVLVLFVVVLVVGGGEHGPGRHQGGVHTGPPPGVTHTQP